MRQIIPFTITILSLTTAIIAGYLYFWYIPNTIEKQVTQSFDLLGFKHLTYASKNHGGGKLVFKDITLDDENFSKIESITVKYSIYAFLTKGQRAQSLTVSDLKLTGELSKEGDANISGWDQKKSIVSMLALIPAETILFENASVDLLTDDFGGVDLKFDVQIANSQGKSAQIKGRAYSSQKKLGFDAKLDGTLSVQGAIDIKADIQKIQMQTTDYEIRRFNANLIWKKEPQTAGNISIEGVAGSILWHKMPLGDVNINYESSADNYNIVAEGKTIGLQSIEFSSQINHVDNITHYETTITPPHVKELLAYFDTNKIITNKSGLPSYILNISQPVFTIKTSLDTKKTPNYEGDLKLISDQPAFEIGGKFKFEADKNLISGQFEMPETTTAIDFNSISQAQANDETMIPEASPASSPVTIDVSAHGIFAIEHWGMPESTLAWKYEISPQNGEITYGQLKLRKISGKLIESSVDTQKQNSISLNYVLPIKDTIPHEGKIFVNLNTPSEPFIKQIFLNIYSGTIQSNTLSFKNGNLPQDITLKIEDINLSSLLQDTRIGGLIMVGQMGGILPLALKDNKIIVKGGILQSEGPGIARISPYVSTSFFPGYTSNMQKIRDALENYHYEFFEIRFDGNFSSSTMMTLTARGFNPDLADKSSVDLNLQIETPISAFLSNLITE